MAKISFVLDGSDEFARRELGAFLREDGEPIEDRHGDMTINFSDVDEGLARWLLSSLSSLHGLSPDVEDKETVGDVGTYDNSPSSPRFRARSRSERESAKASKSDSASAAKSDGSSSSSSKSDESK